MVFGIDIQYVRNKLTLLMQASGIYIIWIIVHYFASHLYVHYCVPESFTGFMQSLYLASTPGCNILRWAITTGGNNINAMWIILITWIMLKFPTYVVC